MEAERPFKLGVKMTTQVLNAISLCVFFFGLGGILFALRDGNSKWAIWAGILTFAIILFLQIIPALKERKFKLEPHPQFPSPTMKSPPNKSPNNAKSTGDNT